MSNDLFFPDSDRKRRRSNSRGRPGGRPREDRDSRRDKDRERDNRDKGSKDRVRDNRDKDKESDKKKSEDKKDDKVAEKKKEGKEDNPKPPAAAESEKVAAKSLIEPDLAEPAPPGEEPPVDLKAALGRADKDEDKENTKKEESKRSRLVEKCASFSLFKTSFRCVC